MKYEFTIQKSSNLYLVRVDAPHIRDDDGAPEPSFISTWQPEKSTFKVFRVKVVDVPALGESGIMSLDYLETELSNSNDDLATIEDLKRITSLRWARCQELSNLQRQRQAAILESIEDDRDRATREQKKILDAPAHWNSELRAQYIILRNIPYAPTVSVLQR